MYILTTYSSMMGLTQEQRQIIDLVNQLPADLKKSTLEILSQMNVSIDTTKNAVKEVFVSADLAREAQEKDENMAYFSISDEKGYFRKEHTKTKMEAEWSYYKINTKTGEIYYISSASDKRAINRADSYLKPVCEFNYSDLNDIGFNKIELIEPGKAQLLNDWWVITKKIKIKLLKF